MEGEVEVKGEYEGIWEEEEGKADYEGMLQPSQQHVALCVKGIKWGLAPEVLKLVAKTVLTSMRLEKNFTSIDFLFNLLANMYRLLKLFTATRYYLSTISII